MISKLLLGIAQAYILILIGRVILSWVPISSGSSLTPLAQFVERVTEPVLAPVRRAIGTAGPFDFSVIIVIVVIEVLVIPAFANL